MRSVPARSVWLTVMVLMGSFIAGPLLGAALGERFAPDSVLAQFVSFFVFPIAFVAGVGFWLGLGVLAVVSGALFNLLRGRRPAIVELAASDTLVPPGYGAFVVFSVMASGSAGLLIGLLSEAALLSTVAAYTIWGAMYGVALWLLAHHGYLPFPEPE